VASLLRITMRGVLPALHLGFAGVIANQAVYRSGW
jgi:hypothetical protein